jgi:hypothetical protein
VTVTLNQAPVANAGSDISVFQCDPAQICIAAGCTDPDGNLATCELVSGVGTYIGTNICFTPTNAGVYTFVLKATDACGMTDYDTSAVTVTLNQHPLFTSCPIWDDDPTTNLYGLWGETFHGTVAAVDPDGLPNPLQYTLINFAGPGTFTVGLNTGVWSWPTILNDPLYLGYHTAKIQVFDGCHTDTCIFDLYVVGDGKTRISKLHDVIQGRYAFDSVFVDAGTDFIGGFDLLISYDVSALSLHDVIWATPPEGIWEYLTYRFGTTGNCNGACPSGLVHLVGIADMNNGFAHPVGIPPAGPYHLNGLLAQLKFLVTSNRTFECQFAPVTFYWIDCTDNVLSSKNGQTAYLARDVWWYSGGVGGDFIRIDNQAATWDGLAGWKGILEPTCLDGSGIPGKPLPLDSIDFWDGGIDIACADSIDARGDLNLNGIANEIADAVIYTQYFLIGIDAFPLNGRQGAIAASDVNADGTPLTIGDLVYMVRIISGDALPFAKLSPFAQEATVRFDGQVVAVASDVNIGAALLTFKVGEDFKVENLTNLSLGQNLTAGELKVLLYDISTKSIGSGLRDLVRIEGQAELVKAEVADYNGSMLTAKIEQAALPTKMALGQNYPNPFNPETVIEFALPTTSDVTLQIYNVAGQLVRTLVNGTTLAGYRQARWDGRDDNGNAVSSGVYFYKISAKDFSETRKMLLVK